MYHFLRNHGMNVKIHHFSIRLCVLSRTTVQQKCGVAFLHSWLYIKGGFGSCHCIWELVWVNAPLVAPLVKSTEIGKPNPGICHTLAKSTIWSHNDQKDRFVIFSRGAPKMGKKCWRETFGSIGVKVWRLSRLKLWIFPPQKDWTQVLVAC